MEEATAVQQEYSAAREIWKKFRKSRTAVSGLAAILFLCAVARIRSADRQRETAPCFHERFPFKSGIQRRDLAGKFRSVC